MTQKYQLLALAAIAYFSFIVTVFLLLWHPAYVLFIENRGWFWIEIAVSTLTILFAFMAPVFVYVCAIQIILRKRIMHSVPVFAIGALLLIAGLPVAEYAWLVFVKSENEVHEFQNVATVLIDLNLKYGDQTGFIVYQRLARSALFGVLPGLLFLIMWGWNKFLDILSTDLDNLPAEK